MYAVGAALTDWGVSVACVLSIARLVLHQKRHCNGGDRAARVPAWLAGFIGVFLSEGIACFGGGFMWAGGANRIKADMEEASAGEHLWIALMILGMEAEGLFLILVSWVLQLGNSVYRVGLGMLTIVFVASCMHFARASLSGAHFTEVYPLLAPLGIGVNGIGGMALKCIRWSDTAAERSCWRWVFGGALLNLVGALVMVVFDDDCSGRVAIQEFLPWTSSPSRFSLATPPGSTCPLPVWFCHGAIMHSCAIVSCALTVPGLCGLLDIGWEPGRAKGKRA